MKELRVGNPRLLSRLEPFVVCTPQNREHFNLSPFGLSIRSRAVIDPLRMSSAPFLALLQRLDTLTFGPEGMPMPRWVFFDGAELPGAIFGFGTTRLSTRTRRLFGLSASHRGLVPYSMFIAIPRLEPGAWMGHNLASLNPVLPSEGLGGLASTTKAFGLEVFRARRCYGVTQWRSLALHIHTKFGVLDLLTAFTPAHSDARSLTYRFDVTASGLRAACGDPGASIVRPRPSIWIDADDEPGLRRLQRQIRRGTRARITGPPRREGDRVRVPVLRRHGGREKRPG